MSFVTPEVYTRVKAPSHVANIKAAQEKNDKIQKQGKRTIVCEHQQRYQLNSFRKLKKFSLFLKEYKLGAQTVFIGRQFHSGTTLVSEPDPHTRARVWFRD